MYHPKCFISYSWDNESHQNWVRFLAEELQKNGIKVLLDQWDVHPGLDLPNYMEKSIRESEYVILVCTPTFAKKTNFGKGGVGYEKAIVTGMLYQQISKPQKFVPIIRAGTPHEALPSYLKSKVFIDFREEDKFHQKFEELLRHLYKMPKFIRPPLGDTPKLEILSSDNKIFRDSAKKTTYCLFCGVKAGILCECYFNSGVHNFVSGTGEIYCIFCGAGVGDQSKCFFNSGIHSFTSGTGKIYCIFCGMGVGSQSKCYFNSGIHSFASGTGEVYCILCGAGIGSQSKCYFNSGIHRFVSGTGKIFCAVCGSHAGTQSKCRINSGIHQFVSQE